MNILRREKLKEFIRQKQVVSLKQLTQEFNDVSVMTLHRDLDFLAKEGFILRIRGGAKYLETEPKGEGIEVQDISNKSQKDIVAQKAVRFVKEGSSIFLDGGTTMLELAKIIPDMYINVTTNGPNIALEIAEKMRPAVTLCGGVLNHKNLSLFGYSALDMISRLNVDVAFISASGYSEEAGLPNEMGLIKNQYVARTFIQPTQELREQGVRMKLSAVRGVVKGKRVVVIDDSIVRGTTSKRIVQMLKEAGAAEVHMRISSPPLKYPCFYGIDISTTKELIAAKKSVDEIRDYIGADSLAFLSLDGLVESIGLGADAPYGGLCVAYFNGDYPTALDDYEADFLKSLTPEDRVRLPEFALYKSKYEGNEYTTTSPQEEH
mgnify:CR=1 FL=1